MFLEDLHDLPESMIRQSNDWMPSLLSWVRKALCRSVSRTVTQSSWTLLLWLSFSTQRYCSNYVPRGPEGALGFICSQLPTLLPAGPSNHKWWLIELSSSLSLLPLCFIFLFLVRGSKDSLHCITWALLVPRTRFHLRTDTYY